LQTTHDASAGQAPSKQKTPLRHRQHGCGQTGEKLAVGADLVGFRIELDTSRSALESSLAAMCRSFRIELLDQNGNPAYHGNSSRRSAIMDGSAATYFKAFLI
jgi:hypothetical protein